MHIFKKLAMLLTMAGLALGFATRASAQITWYLSDVTFSNGNVATGSFVTNSAVNTIISENITISGPDAAADFTATAMSSAYLPGTLGIFDSPSLPYVDLYLAPNSLTGAGGTVPISSGFDCPASGHCGTLVTSGQDPLVTTTPEPATGALLLLGFGLMMTLKRVAQVGSAGH